MSDATEVRVQLRGPGDAGWEGLAPQPEPDGVRWNVFLNKAATKLTLVEALARVVWETTLRLAPTPVKEAKTKGKETLLGLAAIAAGAALENADTLARIEKKVDDLSAKVK